jgi:hypothetical protein
MAGARPSQVRRQVNVPLDDEHWYLALQQLVLRERSTIPEVLRPVIVKFLKRKLDADPELAAAVANVEKSRMNAHDRARRQKKLAPVTELSTAGRSPGREAESAGRRKRVGRARNEH